MVIGPDSDADLTVNLVISVIAPSRKRGGQFSKEEQFGNVLIETSGR